MREIGTDCHFLCYCIKYYNQLVYEQCGLVYWCSIRVFASFCWPFPPPQKATQSTHQYQHCEVRQLQLVPGIGPSTAEKILQMRKSYGAFKSVNDLMAIRGIGPKRLEKMRKYLTVGKSAATGSNTLNLPVAPDAQKQTPTHSQNPPPHRKRRHRPSSRLKKQKNPNIALIGVSGGCPRFVVWVLQLNGSCASPPTSRTKNTIFLMVR